MAILCQENNTDDKSTWRQLTLADGKVAVVEEGSATVTKRPPKP